MLLRLLTPLQRTNASLDSDRDIAGDVTEADFIPYVCHRDARTLLTKNGELLQVLRIGANREGLDYEDPHGSEPPLRHAIRQAIGEHLDSDRIAFWFHVIRRREALDIHSGAPEPFARELQAAWNEQHQWRHRFTNTAYITVMTQGQAVKLFDRTEFRKGLLPRTHRQYREDFLDDAQVRLDACIDAIAATLGASYRVDALAIEDREGTFFSPPLEFLSQILNLHEAPVPISHHELNRQLATDELTFGFDAMESRSASGKRRFGALLSVKGHADLPPEALDRCLQLPEEMIISQSFNFLPRREALERHRALRNLLNAHLDATIGQISGLHAMLDPKRISPVDYGEQQTTIMVLRDQYKLLDDSIGRVQRAFSDLGLITVREDIKLEEAFWSQLPGNFEFLRRKTPLYTERVAGLVRLNHFPSGETTQAHWGQAVTLLPTSLDTPYFFNFHVGDNGHTALLDFNAFADARGASLLNFLLANSRRFEGRILIMDHRQTCRPLVEALGGAYHTLLPEGGGASLDPWRLEDTPRNRAFLAAWLSHCFRYHEDDAEAVREHCRHCVDMLYALPAAERSLDVATQWLQQRHAGLFRAPVAYLGRLFGTQPDTIDWRADILGIELEPLLAQEGLIVPAFAYAIHRLVSTLDGRPTILVLNEAWHLLDNPFFGPRIESLLDMLRQHNTMVIFTTRHPEETEDSFLTQEIMRLTPTKLILPDDVATYYLPDTIGLRPADVKALKQMERQRGDFLVRHGAETVRCRFGIPGLEKFAGALAGDVHSLRLMQIRQE